MKEHINASMGVGNGWRDTCRWKNE